MRKCLLFVALIVSHISLFAQGDLFTSPDTVCPKQPVQLVSNVPNAATHYWGFCSGYAFNDPKATALGKKFALDGAAAIEVEKDGANYFAFVLNRGLNASLVRLEFGNSLDNTPKVTDYGTMDGVLPKGLNSLHIVKDSAKGNWHVFVVGGDDVATSSLARLDFGTTLANTPNIVNFGNLLNTLDRPVGIFIYKEAGKWYGFTFNKTTSDLIRIEFDTLLSFTPSYVNLGRPVGIGLPNDFTTIRHNGVWHFFVTNQEHDSLTRVDMGASLATSTPIGNVIGTFNGLLKNPSGISIIRDCDSFHLFINNKQSHRFVRVDMTSITGTYTPNDFADLGALLAPTGLSRPIRDKDNIFLYAVNESDSNLVKIKFQQCNNTSIQYSTTSTPPPYSYDTAGTYNIYYMVNEGQADMQVQCKLIYVLPTPPIIMSNDTTICQGDTINLRVISVNATSKTWTPNYNISSTTKDEVRAWPEYSTEYRILMPYPAGCIIDTAIRVTVNKVNADAGPDRELADGATTLLGGPLTSKGINFTYTWVPNRYINSDRITNPEATPPYDYTYYLQVEDTSGCIAIDTVVVRVGCNDVNLPNAFVPEGNKFQNRFGLANSQIVKLVFFRVYDRWGKEVFYTDDPTKEWDGTINGDYAPMGVYVWTVDGFCVSGKRLKKSGNVTVIR